MGERRVIVDNLKVEYEGLFNFNELYILISTFFKHKGYDWVEKYAHEKVTKDGKFVEVHIEPVSKLTDYVKSIISIKLLAENLKETTIVKDNYKIKLNDGKVKVVVSAFLETDYEGKWEMKPLYYFLKTALEKFVFTSPLSKYEDMVEDHANELVKEVKSFLNLYRYNGS